MYLHQEIQKIFLQDTSSFFAGTVNANLGEAR